MAGIPAIHELLRNSRLNRTATADALIGAAGCAKVVVCIIEGAAVPAILPVAMAVNTERLLSLAGATEIRLAQDEEVRAFSVDAVYVDVRLAQEPVIVLATETAEETVAIRWSDFARTVRPIVGDFAEPPRDSVGVHRLSYRE